MNSSDQKASIWKDITKKTIFPNGLTIIYQKDEISAITVLQILIKGGTWAVPEGKEGLVYLTTRLAIEIPDRGKIQELMKQASSISLKVRGDYSLINVKCLSHNLEATLKVITKIIQQPLLSGIRISKIKEYMDYKRKVDEDDSSIMGHNAQLNSFFGKTGYGSSVFGSEESLKIIKKKDIESFYRKYFTAKNMIVSVSTDLNYDVLIKILQKCFNQYPQGKHEVLNPNGPSEPQEKNIFLEKDTKQTLVSIAFPLPKVTVRNFVMASLIENLLGKGVNSKLWFLRSREKLAYNVNSQAVQMKEGGLLKAYLESQNNKKDRALEALRKVLLDLYEKGITEEELQTTKTSLKAHFLRINETKEAKTYNLAYFEAVGLGSEFINQFFSEIDAINLEEINAYVKDILDPEKGVEVIVGPESSS